MNDLSARVDRRWDLVILGVVANMCLGTVYSWSVFREPLVATYGFSVGQTGTPYAIFLALFAFSMPLGGWLQTRLGTRSTMAIGAVLVGAGWISAGYATTIAALTMTYGLIGGLGVGISYGVPLTVAGSWFPRRRGLVVGITLGGFGLSPFVTAPLAELLIEGVGVAAAFRILGGAFIVVLFAVTPFMKRAQFAPAETARVPHAGEIGPREMVRSPAFYGLWLTFAVGTFAGLTAIGMSAAYAVEVVRMRPGAAAMAVAGFGVFNGVGRPLFGWITDHVGTRRTALAAFTLIGLGAVLLLLGDEQRVVLYLAGFALLWMLLGGWLAIAPTATTHFFGTRNYAANYGIVYTAYGVGALSGGAVSGYLTARSGSLTTTFWAILVMVALGVIVAILLLPTYSREQAITETTTT
ncbi:MAG: OFA family MFS transporter [Spirochaeta sp.]|jgi:OFA family oxalate/formate antiporter-like MFS transporter|nr:OFA family MFS transporter [Spirochaeta sp.]